MNIERNEKGVFINGERVKYVHFRVIGLADTIEPRGGATLAYLGTRENMTFAGIAYCSIEDAFNYHYGREKARGRLVQGMRNDAVSDDYLHEDYPPKFLRDWSGTDVADVMEALGYYRR